jgi:hypothetical protein
MEAINTPLAAALAAAKGAADLAPIHRPLRGVTHISSIYGNRKDPFTGRLAFHPGIDFAAAQGTTVLSAGAGTVSFVGQISGYGSQDPTQAAGEALPSASVAATLRGRAMRPRVALIASAIALAALGCLAASLVASGAPVTAADGTTATEPPTTVTQATTQSTSVTQTSATTVITPGPGLPSVILPDKKRTPGALNPKVRRSTIKETICTGGWTKTIRPPVAFTNALKIKQMVLYEETGLPSEYEEDHFIPLELGGAPRNPKNLWPEPRSQSKLSDPLENKLKRMVCKGLLRLAKARAAIRLFKNTQG